MSQACNTALFPSTLMSDTPKRLFLLHWLTWLVACTSIVLLLVSRGHYTVDVVLAYYVTTRVW